MRRFALEKQMNTFCVKAHSFPYEIKQAFGELIGKLSSTEGRTFFGISYVDKSGEIIYKAAVLASFNDEGERLGCETFIIPKGDYLTITIKNWKMDELQIGSAFRQLTETKFDFNFPCVEWYQGNDVMCMVKLEKE